jgi:uncharacterized protein YkwD
LSVVARLALYAMLAGLVLASFTMVPGRRAPVIVAPTIEDEPAAARVAPMEDELAAARVAPMSRGVVRNLHVVDELQVDLMALSAATESTDASTVETTLEPPAEPAVEAAPQSVTEPEPEPAPEARPEPPPPPVSPPVARAVAWVTNSTTLWAEGHMLDLMNATRVRGGLAPLAMDIGVADTARAHSAVEAEVRYVYHDGPDGTAGSRNVPACGTGWYGENTGKIWRDNVDALHIEFMAEPWAPINHRTNIMDPAFRRVGVGAVIGADAMYMTMVFCR